MDTSKPTILTELNNTGSDNIKSTLICKKHLQWKLEPDKVQHKCNGEADHPLTPRLCTKPQ